MLEACQLWICLCLSKWCIRMNVVPLKRDYVLRHLVYHCEAALCCQQLLSLFCISELLTSVSTDLSIFILSEYEQWSIYYLSWIFATWCITNIVCNLLLCTVKAILSWRCSYFVCISLCVYVCVFVCVFVCVWTCICIHSLQGLL